MKTDMINHTVFFTLNYPAGSESEKAFFKAAEILPTIPGVKGFRRLKEVSPKNHFDHGFAMKFARQSAYDRYNKHPLHIQFVEQHWMSSVSDFIEIDYEVVT